MCVDGFLACIGTPIGEVFAGLWAEFLKHLPWLGPLFGIVMTAWRWWDKRESVVWRRVIRLLSDQGKFVQDSCAHSLGRILYPTPATPPQRPVFAVRALQKIFARRWWHPLEAAVAAKWAPAMLQQTIEQLNAKDATIAEHRSFAVAQRYSAYVLQGALEAAMASKGTNLQGRNRLNQSALEHFEDALALEGKASDAIVLELKALQLRKLGQIQDAIQVLVRLEELLQNQLQAAIPLLPAQKQTLVVQLLRVVRYHGEIEHEMDVNGAANPRMLALIQNAPTNSIFRSHLELQNLLERAQYHEVHACVRVEFTKISDGAGGWTLPVNGVAQKSLHDARRDYTALAEQVAPHRFSWPIRLWRWLRRSDSKDGTTQLRVAAAQGLRRLKQIEGYKGCQFCQSRNNDAGSA